MLKVSLKDLFKVERMLFIFGIIMFVLAPTIAFHPWLEDYYYQTQRNEALRKFDKKNAVESKDSLSVPNKSLSPSNNALETETIIPVLDFPFKLSMPSIGVTQLVYEGDDRKTLKKGVGHRPKTAKPGEAGYGVLEGHRTPYVFLGIDNLKIGDNIYLSSGKVKLTYKVIDIRRKVYREDLSILKNQPEDSRIILVTCEEPNNNYRILAIAKILEETN